MKFAVLTLLGIIPLFMLVLLGDWYLDTCCLMLWGEKIKIESVVPHRQILHGKDGPRVNETFECYYSINGQQRKAIATSVPKDEDPADFHVIYYVYAPELDNGIAVVGPFTFRAYALVAFSSILWLFLAYQLGLGVGTVLASSNGEGFNGPVPPFDS